MKFDFRKILIVLLYLGGTTFLILSFIAFQTQQPEEISGYPTSEKFDLDRLINNSNFKSETTIPSFEGELMGFLLFNVTDCAPCIKEVKEFIVIMEEDHSNIDHLILVIGHDEQRALKEVIMADFDVPTLYGFDAELVNSYKQFEEGIYHRQLLLIDQHRGEIFYRNKLAKGVRTSRDYKMEVLNKAFNSL